MILASRRLGGTIAIAAALAVTLSVPASARRRPKALDSESAPDWVREAAATDIAPAGVRDFVWLLDSLEVEPLAEGGVRHVTRLVARILDPSAMTLLGDFSAPYRVGDQVERVEVWTLLPDGTCRHSSPRDDVSDLPSVEGYSVYEESRRRVVRTPSAPVGSVVAFESSIVRMFDAGAASFVVGDAARATATSRLTLKVPEGWEYEVIPLHADGANIEVDRQPHAAGCLARDLPPLPSIELLPPTVELLPRIWLRWWSPDGSRGYRTWDDVGRWYHGLADPVLADASSAAGIASRMRPAGPAGLLDSVAEAYRFAAREVRYVSIQIGIGGYKPSSPNEVCNLLYGDCKAKAFLMRAMLESWQQRTFPVIAATRDAGVVTETVPSPAQFNHVILALALPDGVGTDLWSTAEVDPVGRVVFLDPTASVSSPWSLPDAIQGTFGLLVHPDGATLVRLPVQPPEDAVRSRSVDTRLDETGVLGDATLVESWTGSSAATMRAYYASESEGQRQSAIVNMLQRRFPGAALVDHSFDGLDTIDGPVVRRVHTSGGRVGKRVGDLLIVEVGGASDALTGVLPPPPRAYPVDLGAPRQEKVEVRIVTPPGWKPEEIPEPFELEGPDVAASSGWSFADGVLSYHREIEVRSPEVPPERYADLRDQLRRIGAADARAIVLVQE